MTDTITIPAGTRITLSGQRMQTTTDVDAPAIELAPAVPTTGRRVMFGCPTATCIERQMAGKGKRFTVSASSVKAVAAEGAPTCYHCGVQYAPIA